MKFKKNGTSYLVVGPGNKIVIVHADYKITLNLWPTC